MTICKIFVLLKLNNLGSANHSAAILYRSLAYTNWSSYWQSGVYRFTLSTVGRLVIRNLRRDTEDKVRGRRQESSKYSISLDYSSSLHSSRALSIQIISPAIGSVTAAVKIDYKSENIIKSAAPLSIYLDKAYWINRGWNTNSWYKIVYIAREALRCSILISLKK